MEPRAYRLTVRQTLRLPLASPLASAVIGTLVLASCLVVSTTSQSAAQTAAQTAARSAGRSVDYTDFASGAELRGGKPVDVRIGRGRVKLADPARQRTYQGQRYDVGRWISPWATPGFGFTELVASWSATTPRDSWVEVQVRGRAADGTRSSWDTLGRWTSGDRFTKRTTVSGQRDDLAGVNVDTWQVDDPAGLVSWQLRVSLMRKAGASSRPPTLDSVGAMTSRLPDVTSVPTSAPGAARGVVLDVPRYSQMTHAGDYPQWGNGGEAWCSPTSTSMVLGYYDALPRPATYDWVPGGHVDPWVDFAARATYDRQYRGTGNWPFNTAYAAQRTGHAFVTRLRSLREAERLIVAGIPVVASISFGRGELSGAPISASNGHLLVIVGFTQAGDVVVNDPAASSASGVRRTYDRGQFENAWLPTSGGLAYVIRDDAHPLPSGTHSNW